MFEGHKHEVESVSEDGGSSVRFDDKWFRNVDYFFNKAELEGERLTTLYNELYDFDITM